MASRPAGPGPDEETRQRRAEQVGELALDRGHRVAVAESITGGMLSMALARAGRASEWYRGSVVAYASEVKHDLLDVPPGPVVSAQAASAMARRVRFLLHADTAVAVTGAGGPSEQDGREPGTVFVAVDGTERHHVVRLTLAGEPETICAAATLAALDALVHELTPGGENAGRARAGGADARAGALDDRALR